MEISVLGFRLSEESSVKSTFKQCGSIKKASHSKS